MKSYANGLYGWTDNDSNRKATAQTLSYLDVQGVKTIQAKPFIIVEFKGKWFTLTDNGGEINVEPINFQEQMRSIPYTNNERALDTFTMCYRLLTAIKGESIDYNLNCAEGDTSPMRIYTGH